MKLEVYFRHYPEAKERYEAYLRSILSPTQRGVISGDIYVACGMLQFTKDSADNWGGPFPGGYAAYVLRDRSATLYCGGNLVKKNDEWYREHPDTSVEDVTSEKPISLYFCGNDDTSYTKFYRTVEEGLADLELLLAATPLDFHEFIDFGFVFTN